MPKKNGFYIFMLQRQAELEEKGGKISLGQIAGMLNEEWLKLADDEKAKFKNMATQYNCQQAFMKFQAAPQGVYMLYNKDGPDVGSVPPQGLQRQIMMTLREIEDLHTLDESSYEEDLSVRLHLKAFPAMKSDASIPIVLINVNCYNEEPWIPAEVAMCAFSLVKGIYDNYATLIDPQEYPGAMEGTVVANAKLLALPMPNYETRLQNYVKMTSHLAFFINTHSRRYFGDGVLFCLSQDMEKIDACLKWIFKQAGDGFSFKLLSLEILIHHLSTKEYMEKVVDEVLEDFAIKLSLEADLVETPVASDDEVSDETGDCDSKSSTSHSNNKATDDPKPSELEIALAKMTTATEGLMNFPLKCPLVEKGLFTTPEHVLDFLQCNNYSCYEELACLYHLKRWDGVPHCAMNVTNRYAYGLLHVLVSLFGVIPQPGIHYPNIHENNYLLERQRRIDMLMRWAPIDYAQLADDQKFGDLDLMLMIQLANVKRYSDLKRHDEMKKPEEHFEKPEA